MKFARVEGKRREAQPGLSAQCPVCEAAMIAKCGDIRAPHWAHRRKTDCDHWWETETEWHRDWKNQFSEDWQEIIQRSAEGEKHIADVKTPGGLVMEFKYSPIDPEERKARESFYGNMVWVVNGTRLVRDKSQFYENHRTQIGLLIGFAHLFTSVSGWSSLTGLEG